MDGDAVLADLGLVRPLTDIAVQSTVKATPAYSAPEQLLGHPLDGRADVFALGVTLHDLLAARLPAQRPRPHTLGLERLDELDRGIDRGIASVVAQATAPDVDQRYRSAADLRHDLLAWLAGGGTSISLRPSARRSTATRRAVRRFIGAGLAAALLTTWALEPAREAGSTSA